MVAWHISQLPDTFTDISFVCVAAESDRHIRLQNNIIDFIFYLIKIFLQNHLLGDE
jgi:hypothetical protein